MFTCAIFTCCGGACLLCTLGSMTFAARSRHIGRKRERDRCADVRYGFNDLELVVSWFVLYSPVIKRELGGLYNFMVCRTR